MTRTRFAVVLALALVPAVPAFAQEAQEDASSAPGKATPAPTPEPEDAAPPARDDSPYDYQASEEISEDLSVSFPVDI